MGFAKVYDFAAGKKAWGSFGLPHEGTNVPERSAADVAYTDVPTCHLGEAMTEVRERVREAGWGTCIVVNEQGIVLGRVGRRGLAADDEVTVEEAMSPGPSTVRPSIGTDALLERMRSRDLTSFVVTTPDGRLVGLVRRSELE
jgi:CBS domain-containing protein